jgi:eukaryotic-like serine/threonine-protein kinase
MAETLAQDRLLGGRYRLLIAHGPTATSWEAEDTVLGRRVWVRACCGSDAERAEFLAGARDLARIRHAGVVETYDSGTDDTVAFSVGELPEACTPLREHLDQHGPFTGADAATAVHGLAELLLTARAVGVRSPLVDPDHLVVTAAGTVRVRDLGGPADDVAALGAVLQLVLGPPAPSEPPSDLAALATTLAAGRNGPVADLPAAELALRSHVPVPEPETAPPVPAPALRPLRERVQAATPAAVAPSRAPTPEPVPWTTPPTGVVDALPPDRGRHPGAGRVRTILLVLVGVAVVTGLVVGAAAVFAPVGRAERRDDTAATTDIAATDDTGADTSVPAGDGTVPTIAEVRDFDPRGDGAEHSDTVGLVVDGDPTTTWRSDRYETDRFSGLKPGLGIVLVLDGEGPIGAITIESPEAGWTARVAVADTAADDLDGWTDAGVTATAEGTTTTFELGDRRGAAVLVWFTRLPPSLRLEIGEIRLGAAT